MTLPFFSIIIPSLNEAKYLPNLLTDLKDQTFQNFEVLVVDGHSDDQTVFKAKSFKSKLPSLVILNSQKRHVCTQRNLGANKAHANWFIFMDADNRLPPHFLQGIKYRLELSRPDILTTRFKPDIDNPTNRAVATAVNLFLELQNDLKPTYLLESMIVVSRKCFTKIKGFDESVDYAEGKSFIQTATKLGFKSQYSRDPIYTFSFRRFRKYGVMGLATRTARMELYRLLDLDPKHAKNYPMQGGSFFEESKRQKLLANLQKRLRTSASRRNFLAQLEKIKSTLLTDPPQQNQPT